MSSTPEIPGYDLLAQLGAGSFATVWSAYDLRLDREVAVKILAEDWCRNPEVRRRFMNEARVLVTSESPRLARGFIVDETADGRPYLVMALADRGTLGERMAQRFRAGRRFSPLETFAVIGELAKAIGDVHALGHLHRDVKPSNVLIMEIPRGSSGRALPGLAFDERIVLSDFGLVSRLESHDGSSVVGGSPGYVAPEQAAGGTEVDERADLFPLGVIALEMMTGRTKQRPTSLDQARTARHDPRGRLESSVVDVPDQAVELLTQVLQPDRANRPDSATDTANRCAAIVVELEASESPARAATSETPSSDRRGVWGQDLKFSAEVPSQPISEPADETVIRPRNIRAPASPTAPADESDPEPHRSRSALYLDIAIGATAIVLLAVAAFLWLT